MCDRAVRTGSSIIHQLVQVDTGQSAARVLADSPELTAEQCRRGLEEMPLDLASFEAEYGISRQRATDHIAALYATIAECGDARVGSIGLILFTLRLVHYFDSLRGHGRAEVGDRPALRAARAMLSHRLVRDAWHAVYAPELDRYPPGSGPDDATAARQRSARLSVWESIDLDDAQVYRLGTTSFIVRTSISQVIPNARRSQVAVKCVVLPYARIHAIALATERYSTMFERVPQRSAREIADHFPVVHGSSQAWVIMEFVPGPTLAEILRDTADAPGSTPRRRRRAVPALRLDLLAAYGPLVFDALANLQQAGLAHLDLTPSNIIIEQGPPGGTPRAVIVDFGRNYLYSRSIGVMEGPEGAYVAPEVKASVPDDVASPDLYSLGKLLIALGGADPARVTLVPDQFYLHTPALARFVEDLVDGQPARRLVCYGSPGWTYITLKRYFMLELDALREAAREGVADPRQSGFMAMLDLFRPSARSPSRQLRLWRARLNQLQRAYSTGPDSPVDLLAVRTNVRIARMLLLWSALCSACWGIFLTLMSVQVLRDVDLDPTPLFVEAVDRLADLTGLASEFTSVADDLANLLGQPGAHNLGARLVGASFALVNVRLYQNVFAGVTPLLGWSHLRPVEKLHALAAEALIRLFAFWWLVLVLGPQFGHPGTWPLWVFVGLTGTLLLNWSVMSFAAGAVARAQDAQLGTIPPHSQQITGLALFSRWGPSMLAYLVVIGPAAWLIYIDVLQDELMYAVMLAGANVGVFYFVKCTMDAPEIRIGLARAFLASERAAVIGSRASARGVPEPRASGSHPSPASAAG